MITHNFWHFWTFHVKRMFQENSPVHINVCRLDALVEPDGFFSFSQSFLRYSTLLMHGSHILCSTSCPRLQKKEHIFGLYQPWNIIQHPEAVQNWIMGGRVMFQFIFKCFPVERDRIQLDWYWAMLSLALHLQLFPFAFRFPLTISTCWTADCVWIAAHGHCMCVCYCRYMTPSQLLLEDARVFPFGWTEKKKNPPAAKN